MKQSRRKRKLALSANAGRFALTGGDSVPRRLRVAFTGIYVLQANAGAFALTGKAAILSAGGGATSPGQLTTLAANTARNIGAQTYWDSDPQWMQQGGTSPATYDLQAYDITDFSGVAMDAARNRVLLYGGGHGHSQQTNIRALDLSTLTWSNLATSTPAASMINSLDSNYDKANGSWISSGQPGARHTYNMNVVRGNEMLCMSPRGMPFYLGATVTNDWTSFWGGRMPRFNFTTGAWTYSQYGSGIDSSHGSVAPFAPWSFQSAACLDPVSNKILIAGMSLAESGGGIFLYDRDADIATTGASWPDPSVQHAETALVYFPPNDKFYCFVFAGAAPANIAVYEITLDRTTFSNSTLAGPLSTTGTPPGPLSNNGTDYQRRCGFAYDSVNGIIGGQPMNGVFYTFAPVSRVWTATTMLVESGSAGTPQMGNNTLTFDPNSGCYIFIDHPGSGPTSSYPQNTWAYRPAASGGVAVSDLSITLDFGGGSIATFSGANAVDKGDYIGEFVRQKSYMVTNAAFPDWRVWFRVDATSTGIRIAQPATGWRDEVIVEYGRTTNGTPTHRLTPYTATIKKNGTTVYTVSVPVHFWFSRWRYQSSQRAVVRTPATLIARNWLPKFGTNGAFGRTADTIDTTWSGPFMAPTQVTTGNRGASSVWNNFCGLGGDHDEIGYLTEQAASYVLFSNANSLRTVRAQGEWVGNWCIHMRTDSDGSMPSFRDTTSRVTSSGGTINEVTAINNAAFVNIDYNTGSIGAHYYANSNLPWLLFDDPWHLEDIQFGVNLRMVNAYGTRSYFGLGGLIPSAQDRQLYWGLRDLFLLAKTTPAATPAWLRNQAHWQNCLEDNRQMILQFVNATSRVHQTFRSWPRWEASAIWENSWGSAIVGMGVLAGFTQWQSVFDWAIQKQIQMSNGTSGWNKQWPVAYIASPVNNGTYYNANDGRLNSYLPQTNANDSNFVADWAGWWNFYKAGGGVGDGRPTYGATDSRGTVINDTGWDGHTLMCQFATAPDGSLYGTNYTAYVLHLRSALAVASTVGTTGASACYNYIHTEYGNSCPTWSGISTAPCTGELRFSIDP